MGTEQRGPADLGEATMPDTEHRDPSTRHGSTETPADLEDEGIGDKLKDKAGGIIGKAKGMLGNR
ncbi:MAG: hypothetical protein ACRDKW_00785 [Actinomycetota bacterium]